MRKRLRSEPDVDLHGRVARGRILLVTEGRLEGWGEAAGDGGHDSEQRK